MRDVGEGAGAPPAARAVHKWSPLEEMDELDLGPLQPAKKRSLALGADLDLESKFNNAMVAKYLQAQTLKDHFRKEVELAVEAMAPTFEKDYAKVQRQAAAHGAWHRARVAIEEGLGPFRAKHGVHMREESTQASHRVRKEQAHKEASLVWGYVSGLLGAHMGEALMGLGPALEAVGRASLKDVEDARVSCRGVNAFIRVEHRGELEEVRLADSARQRHVQVTQEAKYEKAMAALVEGYEARIQVLEKQVEQGVDEARRLRLENDGYAREVLRMRGRQQAMIKTFGKVLYRRMGALDGALVSTHFQKWAEVRAAARRARLNRLAEEWKSKHQFTEMELATARDMTREVQREALAAEKRWGRQARRVHLMGSGIRENFFREEDSPYAVRRGPRMHRIIAAWRELVPPREGVGLCEDQLVAQVMRMCPTLNGWGNVTSPFHVKTARGQVHRAFLCWGKLLEDMWARYRWAHGVRKYRLKKVSLRRLVQYAAERRTDRKEKLAAIDLKRTRRITAAALKEWFWMAMAELSRSTTMTETLIHMLRVSKKGYVFRAWANSVTHGRRFHEQCKEAMKKVRKLQTFSEWRKLVFQLHDTWRGSIEKYWDRMLKLVLQNWEDWQRAQPQKQLIRLRVLGRLRGGRMWQEIRYWDPVMKLRPKERNEWMRRMRTWHSPLHNAFLFWRTLAKKHSQGLRDARDRAVAWRTRRLLRSGFTAMRRLQVAQLISKRHASEMARVHKLRKVLIAWWSAVLSVRDSSATLKAQLINIVEAVMEGPMQTSIMRDEAGLVYHDLRKAVDARRAAHKMYIVGQGEGTVRPRVEPIMNDVELDACSLLVRLLTWLQGQIRKAEGNLAATEDACRETVRDLRAREEARKSLRLELYGKKAEARRQEAVREAERAWDLQGGRDLTPHPGAVAQTGTPLLQSRTYTPVYLPLGGAKPMGDRGGQQGDARPHTARAAVVGGEGGAEVGPAASPLPPRPRTGGGVRIKYAPLEDSTAARPRGRPDSSPLYTVAPPGDPRPHTARAPAPVAWEAAGGGGNYGGAQTARAAPSAGREAAGGGGNFLGSRPSTARSALSARSARSSGSGGRAGSARGGPGVPRGLALQSQAQEQLDGLVRRQAISLQATKDEIAGMWQAVNPAE